MSWTQSQADIYFDRIRIALADEEIELRGELWDYNAKIRMKAFWPGGEWEFAKDWRVEELPEPAHVAQIVRERRWGTEAAAWPEGLSPGELRAFEFGPRMRRLADARFGGNLDRAYQTEAPDRVALHRKDVDAIRPEHRGGYARLILEADNSVQ